MSRRSRILVVEDDDGIAVPLVEGLRSQGYDVTRAGSAAEAEAAAAEGGVALVLLDLGLPDLDGIVLCRRLRDRLPGAVIVALTARDAEIDVVVTLDAGADDYLIKPFRFAELLARLRAHLRRTEPVRPGATSSGSPEPLAVGDVELDTVGRRCHIAGNEVELRPKEFELLRLLMEEAGRAVSRERLMSEVWDENWYGSTKTLDMHIAMLRRRLADNGADPAQITTLRGHGYRFERTDGPGQP